MPHLYDRHDPVPDVLRHREGHLFPLFAVAVEGDEEVLVVATAAAVEHR
jgi:hypothetical protein